MAPGRGAFGHLQTDQKMQAVFRLGRGSARSVFSAASNPPRRPSQHGQIHGHGRTGHNGGLSMDRCSPGGEVESRYTSPLRDRNMISGGVHAHFLDHIGQGFRCRRVDMATCVPVLQVHKLDEHNVKIFRLWPHAERRFHAGTYDGRSPDIDHAIKPGDTYRHDRRCPKRSRSASHRTCAGRSPCRHQNPSYGTTGPSFQGKASQALKVSSTAPYQESAREPPDAQRVPQVFLDAVGDGHIVGKTPVLPFASESGSALNLVIISQYQ